MFARFFCCISKKQLLASQPSEVDQLDTLSENKILALDSAAKKASQFAGFYTAKMLSNYDGDTCNLCFFFRNELISLKCRLAGIDAPEIRTKSAAEKEAGIKAKTRLAELVCLLNKNNIVKVIVDKNDKYGRPLVTIFNDINNSPEWYVFENSINQQLITERHAQPYDGKTKNEWIV